MHLLVLDEFDQMDPERLQQAVDVVALFLNIWDKGTYYDGTDALVETIPPKCVDSHSKWAFP